MDSPGIPALTTLDAGVFVYTRPLPGFGGRVSAALFLGEKTAVVIDTMRSPRDMETFAGMVGERGVFVVYTHADWDHCLGSAAFRWTQVIAHDLALARLTGKERPDVEAISEIAPELVEEGSIVLPSVTFSRELTLGRIHLSHLPGHTPDSIVCFEEGSGVLVAGDAAEDPIPSVGDATSIGVWTSGLERWAPVVRAVVPGHGRPQGPELLLANARYLRGLAGLAERAASEGATPEALVREFPLEKAFPEALPALRQMHPRDQDFYVEAHKKNLLRAFSTLA